MEYKTKIHAEDGKQEITITRAFDLPVQLLFKAHADAELVSQWMDNKVVKFEPQKHGCYQYEKLDGQGNIVFSANGTFHELVTGKKITRTFEMENTSFPVQLEFLEFEELTDDTSKLTMHIIYKSVAVRDAVLKLPFQYGLNMAHDLLEKILNNKK